MMDKVTEIIRHIIRIQSQNGGVSPHAYCVTQDDFDAIVAELNELNWPGQPPIKIHEPLRIYNVPIVVEKVMP